MKFLLFTDPHWSQNSSVVRTQGQKYSTRLENLIHSMNWLENLAVEKHCDKVICAGDFFDSTQLNSQEVTALKEIRWNGLPHVFLMGNHEASTNTLEYSTLDVFQLLPNATVINSCCSTWEGKTEICFLPYITDRDRKSLTEYFGVPTANQRRIIISHNDLKDVQYGGYISKSGVELTDIDNSCDLFFNGHIHNCSWVDKKTLNIGNLTGSAFGEDGYKYQHYVVIVDTDHIDDDPELIENPFAFNFFKLDFTNCSNDQIENILYQLVDKHPVISATVTSDNHDFVKQLLDKIAVVSRVISSSAVIKQDLQDTSVFTGVDHLQQFREYVKQVFGNNDVCNEELEMIMR